MVFHVIEEVGRHWPLALQRFELVCALLVALLAGTALYWLVERPFLMLRNRLPGSRAIALTVKAHS